MIRTQEYYKANWRKILAEYKKLGEEEFKKKQVKRSIFVYKYLCKKYPKAHKYAIQVYLHKAKKQRDSVISNYPRLDNLHIDTDELKTMYKDNSMSNIAKQLNISITLVRKLFKKHKIKAK